MWVCSHSVTVGTWRPISELDDAQRLVRAVILQQRLETLCSWQVFESLGALPAVLTADLAHGRPQSLQPPGP
jgi:hypothetical protein